MQSENSSVVALCSKCGAQKVGRRCPPCARAGALLWKALNPERSKASNDAWRTQNPIKAAESVKKSRAKNPEKTKATSAAWATKNTGKIQATNRRWKDENRGERKIKEAAERADLADAYIAKLLKLPMVECSPELMELTRQKILLGRKIAEMKKKPGEPGKGAALIVTAA